MHSSKLILIPAVATIAMVVSAASVVAHGYNGTMVNMAAQSYSGSWPVTVTRSQHSNGTDCLLWPQMARRRLSLAANDSLTDRSW